MWSPDDQKNANAGAAALKEIGGLLRVLDDALRERPFLTGEYTLADAHVNSFIDWLRHMKIDMNGLERLGAWSQRCSARPAHTRAMARDTA
jgi:glutathione S-transferase